MDHHVSALDGASVTVVDFNYQHVTVTGLEGQPQAQLEFAPGVPLDLEQVEGRKDGLYLVKNWEEISGQPALRQALDKIMKGSTYEKTEASASI